MRIAKTMKRIAITAAVLIALVGSAVILLWLTTFHPQDGQTEPIFCDANAPILQAGQTVKVLSWNVQFMAGKGYLFFFEVPNDAGPDERPSPESIARTVDEVARVICEEDPDIVLLQEVDDGAKRTDYADQLRLLLEKLPPTYCCHTSTFYWKARFVPHRRIMGSVGMKLSTISKYRIVTSVRHSLAAVPHNVLTRQFHPKRAILETRFPVEGGSDLAVLNLHLEAFAEGSDVKARQVDQMDAVLTSLSKKNLPFIAGGDFNLLPPGQRSRLTAAVAAQFSEDAEMSLLYDKFQVIPSLTDVNGPTPGVWFTYLSNDPNIVEPDRTIDYLVLPPQAQLLESYVRQHDTQTISDHMPVVAVLQLD